MHRLLPFLFILSQLIPASSCSYEALSDEIFSQIQPYLLPKNHPAKKGLDRIFKKRRATMDEKSLEKSGFIYLRPNNLTKNYVATHLEIGPYLIKFLLDSQLGISDSNMCLSRIKGANIIRKGILDLGYDNYFTVPQKWIYLLPNKHLLPKEYDRKHMILVVEKIPILSHRNNQKCWKSSRFVTNQLLKAMFDLLSKYGLIDSVYIDNIPFSKDGRIAFIDTEHAEVWPVPYSVLSRYLSDKRRKYWEELVNKNLE